jgi:hypothetical protein
VKIQVKDWFLNILKADNQCVLYAGQFSDEITDRVIQLAEFNVDSQYEEKKVKKRVSFLLAECFQNVIRHGEGSYSGQEFDPSRGFFMTRNVQGFYNITSGNLIEKILVEKLKGQLEQVNKLNTEELKALYRKVITEGEMSSKGGAGLGLIDMARKSWQKLRYRFNSYDEKYELFYNEIILKSEKNETVDPAKLSIDINNAIKMHHRLIDDNILMLQKGNFSRDSIIPVLKIMENNVVSAGKDVTSIKQMFHVVVELLQNISRHGYRDNDVTQGIFIMACNDDNYQISAGNLIENRNVGEFRNLLHRINQMNEDEMRQEYLHLLKNGNETENGGAGIGLIDIARLVEIPFDYEFHNINEDMTFFSISMTI